MGHTHDHDAERSTYYLEQLSNIGICGALGGVCIMLYVQQKLGIILNSKFFLPVLLGGIALLVMVVVRAIAVWQSAGQTAHAHDHGHDHEHDHSCGHEHHHDCGHEHEHAHQHGPACDHDHGHEHAVTAEAHHGGHATHSHDHGITTEPLAVAPPHEEHDHGSESLGEHDHGHDHGWSPWRYAVLLLPVMLFLLNLPSSGGLASGEGAGQVETKGTVSAVAFSPDGKRALSASEDKTLKLWDLAAKKEIRTLKGHQAEVYAAAFSPDGRFALSGSEDKTVRLWDVTTGKEICTFTGHDTAVYAVAFSPDGRFALSGGADGTLKLWDVAALREVRERRSVPDYLKGVTQVGLLGQLANLVGVEAAQQQIPRIGIPSALRTFTGHEKSVTSVAFSPDGRHILSGSRDHTLKLWDVETGKLVRSWEGGQGPIYTVAFSPDGRQALSGGFEPVLRLWDVAYGTLVRSWEGMQGPTYSVAFSPDGRQALSGGYDKSVWLWDLAGGKEGRAWSSHQEPVASVAFSTDGKLALSGSYDKTLELWDVPTTQALCQFTGHGGTQFGSGGKALALDFKELEQKAATPEGRRYYDGKTGRIKGQYRPGENNKTFSLVRFKIQCCAADAIPLNVKINTQDEVPSDIKPLDWVEVEGLIQFGTGRNGSAPILGVPAPSKDHIRKIPPDPNPYLQ
jgi:WD40 repeat protein